MPKNRINNLLRGAFILSLSSLIAKILSAVYRVPFQNLVGNTGFYVYQQIYPLYGIGMTFALSGFPIFISKLVAEQPDLMRKRLVVRRSMWVLLGLSLVLFVGLQVGAGWLATKMGDWRLGPIIQAVSWMFLLMPFLAAGRGYYQGQFQMGPTALSQLVEQTVRVAVILIVAWLAVRYQWNVYYMGSWAMSSAAIAAVAATAIFLPFMTHQLWRPLPDLPGVPDYRQLLKRFIVEGGTVCLFAAIVILLQLVDSFSVLRGLLASGLPADLAKSVKGVYDRGQPLVQLGLVVATSFSAMLLPALTHALQKKQPLEFKRNTRALVHVSLALSVAATLGLIALMPAVDLLLFGSTEGVRALDVYMLSILFAALITTYNSVLQSLDQYRVMIVGIFAGLLVKVVLNYGLVVIWGITGASLATAVSLAVVFLIMWLGSPDDLKAVLFESGFLIKLTTIGLAMLVVVHFVSRLGEWFWLPGHLTRGGAGVITVLGIIAGVVVFVVGALMTKLFSIRELVVLPYGKTLLKKLVKQRSGSK